MNFKIENKTIYAKAYEDIRNLISTKATSSDLNLYNLNYIKSYSTVALHEGGISYTPFINVKNILNSKLSRKVQVEYKDLVLFFLLVKHIYEYDLYSKAYCSLVKLWDSISVITHRQLKDLTASKEFSDIVSGLDRLITELSQPYFLTKSDLSLEIIKAICHSEYYRTLCFMGFSYKQLHSLARYIKSICNSRRLGVNKNIKLLYIKFDTNFEDREILERYDCFQVNSIQKYISKNHKKDIGFPLKDYPKNNHILFSNNKGLSFNQIDKLGSLANLIEMGDL